MSSALTSASASTSGTGARTEHRTACPLDCPDTCSLTVTVIDGRLVEVDAAPDGEGNPLTHGFICKKVKHHSRRVYAPERIMTPLLRTGPKGSGRHRPATWDEALDLVADRVRSALSDRGPDAVIPYLYSSSGGLLARGALGPHVSARLGLPVVDETICAETAGAAWRQVFGDMLSADPLDVPHAQLVVVWGANPTVSNTHLLPLLTESKRRGGALVAIDPRRTGVATRADLHLPLRPGTDVVLAYAVVRRLQELDAIDTDFCSRHADGADELLAAAAEWTLPRAAEVCGLSEEAIEEFARLVATRRPAMLRMGWGVERNRNGGSGFVAALGLWVLAGHFGVQGSGVLTSTSRAAPVSMDRLWPEGVAAPARRHVSMNDIGRMLCGLLPGWGRPSVLFVQGANPAVSAVDQGRMLEGLSSDEVFTVVHDQVMTDTARYADVVLPATTHFEAQDVAVSYGSYVMQPMPAIIDRVGLSRTNDEVWSELGARLGLGALDADPTALVDRVTTDGRAGATPRRLRAAGATVQFVDTIPSLAGGRAQLCSPASELPLPRYVPLDSPYPLTLISPATPRMINSMFGEFDPPDVVVSMNPSDAAERGVVDGQRVAVVNDQGVLHLPARIDGALRPGVCQVPKGIWLRDFEGGRRGLNLLVPGASSDLAAGACFNDTRVDVRADDDPAEHGDPADRRRSTDS